MAFSLNYRIIAGLLVVWVGSVIFGAEGFTQAIVYTNAGRQGDQYYEAQQYYRAVQYYQIALKQDSTDDRRAFRLAESYRHQFEYAQALRWYDYVQERAAAEFPEATYYKALMLKTLGRCAEAVPILEGLIKQPAGLSQKINENLLTDLQGCYDKQLAVVQQISLQKLDSPLNSAFHDYAPLILENDSVLSVTSTRFSGKQRLSYRFGENNANFYEFLRDKMQWKPAAILSSRVNTKASEGAGWYVPERDEFYFTYCPDNRPCQIQVIRRVNGKWQSPESLNENINLRNTHSKHPALTLGGDTLFFVSDRSGGYGGTDIWMSVRAGEQDWSPPLCLDTLINSSADEVTPCYDSREKQLIFASNGHKGYGGMDLFLVTDYGHPTRKSRNHLPAPFNSNADDGYLVLGQSWGYLASHRGTDFDIYAFRKDSSQTWKEYLLGIVPLANIQRNEYRQIYPDQIITANISLPGEIKDWVRVQSAQQKRLKSGATRFILNSDVNDIRFQQYQQQQRENPRTDNSAVSINSFVGKSEDSTAVLAQFSTDSLDGSGARVITGTLQQGSDEAPLSKKTLQLRDAVGKVVKITTTNVLGNFRLVNIQPAANYSLVLVADTLLDSLQVVDLQLLTLDDELSSQTYEPIFYDFNQNSLRPEAKKVLESLADFYQQHPSISIEINAFTDSLGNDQYNLLLSQKRGEAAFDYLIEQGVDRSALAINAQGVSTAYTSTNAFVSQQLNRRVEFVLFGLESPLQLDVVTRVLRPNVSMDRLLGSTGVSTDTLEELNGASVTQLIKPYKPLRLPRSVLSTANELFYKIIDIN